MKLALDPMPALRMAAKSKVNMHFDRLAQPHRDAAYTMKRSVAAAGAPFPYWFAEEAGLRGITVNALASTILSKPDLVIDRELHRQRVMAEIDAATTPVALSDVVDKLRHT